MDALEILNKQYTDNKRKNSLLHDAFLNRNSMVIKNESDIVSNDRIYISTIMNKIDCSNYALLQDAYSLTGKYVDCERALISYRELLLAMKKADEISRAQKTVVNAQAEYEKIKKTISEKYKMHVDTPEEVHDVIVSAFREASEQEREVMKEQQQEAKRIIDELSPNLVLRKEDPIDSQEVLPQQLLIAKKQDDATGMDILRDIGMTHVYKNIYTDIQEQGNVIISTNINSMEDKAIDEFIAAYIFRFLEAFPLESINVHIFDDNTKFLFKRLNNCFQNDKNGDKAKRTIRIHTLLKDLETIRDVECEDIFNKLTLETPDLYSVYNSDKSDPFNLIILRDGMLDGSGYATAEILDTINALTNPSETGHRCGIRFLIIDNSLSFENNQTTRNKQLLESIRNNCELILDYDEKKGFSYQEKPLEVIHIDGNIDAFVQERSKALVEAINKREKRIITIEEVSAGSANQQMDNVMYIPVGKTGKDTVELPLSCREEGGSVAGQCIGYIAIGQSGSGKSSFFHSLVLNGCMKYSPKDLQFWLLDFKNGGASSKYSNSGIPHIKIIAENNRIDDALCLFQMILEEMKRRNKAFNDNFANDIIEYNKKAEKNGLEYFPRIIIAIDEVQEIFREDNAAELKNLISQISSRMRSAGMHFVMVAQNLSEGKSYMLKESFMHSAAGRICFRVAQDAIRDSGFGEEFTQRRQEIAELKAGEAYISYGPGTIRKIKMAYVSTEDMSEKVFRDICEKYKEYSNLKPKVIGSRTRLSPVSTLQGIQEKYLDVFNGLSVQECLYDAVLGEDVYRMDPFYIRFSQDENSAVLVLGDDKQLSSSICTSIAVSLLRQNVEVHLFNSDITKITVGSQRTPHPFMYLCQSVEENKLVQNHRMNELTQVIRELYTEFLKRQKAAQKAENDDLSYSPIFLMIHDLLGIESFTNNEIIESAAETTPEKDAAQGGFGLDFSILSGIASEKKQNDGQFREGIQNIMGNLLKNGYRYNMHVILAIRGDSSVWRMGRTISTVNNILMFNKTDYVEQIDNSYYLKEMLKNISNEEKEETLAVWVKKESFSKIRPVIYQLTVPEEKEALDELISGREMNQ